MLATQRKITTLVGAGRLPEVRESNWSGDLSTLAAEVCSKHSITTLRRDRDFMDWRIKSNRFVSVSVLELADDGYCKGALAVAVGEDRSGYICSHSGRTGRYPRRDSVACRSFVVGAGT